MRYLILYIFLFFLLLTFTGSSLLEFDLSITNDYSMNRTEFNHSFEHFKSNDFIPTDITRIGQKLYTLTISLGTPPQYFNLIFDTGSFITWVESSNCIKCSSPRRFFPLNSNTFVNSSKEYSIDYLTGRNKGYIAYESIGINNFILKSFGIMLSTNSEINISGIEGIMGLGKESPNEASSFSIIDSLKRNNIINRRIFSQKIVERIRGKLYIGDYAEEIKRNLGDLTVCNTNKYDSPFKFFWSCYFSHYIIGDKIVPELMKPVGEYSIFDTGTNIILAPMKYLELFQLHYLNPFLKTGVCFSIQRKGLSGISIICDKKRIQLNEFPPISFIFNGWAYQIPGRDLWEDTGFVYEFVIYFSEEKFWLFGQPFLRNFHIVFDKDNEIIGFHNGIKYNLTQYTSDPVQKKSYFQIIVVILLISFVICCVFYLVYRKCRRIRNNSQNQYYNPESFLNIQRNRNDLNM